MYRIPGAYSRKTTTSAPAAPPVRIPGRAEDRERIATGLNDVVVRRLLSAGEDLQAALGLMADHPANGKIRHTAGELDQAIRDIPDTVFDRPATEQPAPGTPASTT
jgi:hypothetical protein